MIIPCRPAHINVCEFNSSSGSGSVLVGDCWLWSAGCWVSWRFPFWIRPFASTRNRALMAIVLGLCRHLTLLVSLHDFYSFFTYTNVTKVTNVSVFSFILFFRTDTSSSLFLSTIITKSGLLLYGTVRRSLITQGFNNVLHLPTNILAVLVTNPASD